jgi:hypothetical protein
MGARPGVPGMSASRGQQPKWVPAAPPTRDTGTSGYGNSLVSTITEISGPNNLESGGGPREVGEGVKPL